MNRIKTILGGLVSLFLILVFVYEATKWTVMRVYVGPDEALVVINKFGDALPADKVVVPVDQNDFKGVQEEVRGPGRYFINPVSYDTKIVPLLQIPAGSPERWNFTPEGKTSPTPKPRRRSVW